MRELPPIMRLLPTVTQSLRTLSAIALLIVPTIAANADIPMAFYNQCVTVRFKNRGTERAHVRIAPLFHNFDAAFASRWDDNNKDDARVQTLMAKYGQHGTFYLNDPDGTDGTNKTLLTGGNAIGIHTLSHDFMTALSGNRAFREILADRIALEVDAQAPAAGFVFPFMNYRAEFDPDQRQADLEEMLVRSGVYFAGENRHDFVSNRGLLAADFISIDGNPWSGVTKAGIVAMHREPKDRPLLLSTMHAWPDSWGGLEFPKLAAEYEEWGHEPNWWYCNEKEYASYRQQFLQASWVGSVFSHSIIFGFYRLDPLDLNDLTPLTVLIEGVSSDDIESITSPTATVSFPNPADHRMFDLSHDTGRGLPERYGRTDNLKNSSHLSEAAAPVGLPDVRALLAQHDGHFILQIQNTGHVPMTDLRVVFRLPLRWQDDLKIHTLPNLAPGQEQTVTLTPGIRSNDWRDTSDTELDVAQIDYRAGTRVRLYATCEVNASAPDTSYPQNGFLELGPLPRDHAGFDYASFVRKVMTTATPKAPYTLFDNVRAVWTAPTPAQTAHFDPDLIWTTGHAADLTSYPWDPKLYYKHGKDLHYVLWGQIISPSVQTVTAQFVASSMEQIMVNGAAVVGNKITLRQGTNDIRLLYNPASAPGYSVHQYGAYFRLVDKSGTRVTNITFQRPHL